MPLGNVEIEIVRGGIVESRHLGSAALVRAGGRVETAWGDIEAPVFARSAIKPLQAIPLLESGAADRFELGPAHIALASGSHSGEPLHVEAVRSWLTRLGLGEKDLECGIHPPWRLPVYAELVRSGEPPTAAYNNCSGKHTGFLTTAVHLGEPIAGYIGTDHPVQRRVCAVYADLSGFDMTQANAGTDGCGIPTLGIPLRAMALAMARMADPAGLASRRAEAIARIRAAIWAEPVMVAGSNDFCTNLNAMLAGRAAVKTGAEGVYCAMLTSLGLGLAIKIHDGAGRAAEVALAAVLHHLGLIDGPAHAELLHPTVRNVVGKIVGEMRPARAWLSA